MSENINGSCFYFFPGETYCDGICSPSLSSTLLLRKKKPSPSSCAAPSPSLAPAQTQIMHCSVFGNLTAWVCLRFLSSLVKSSRLSLEEVRSPLCGAFNSEVEPVLCSAACSSPQWGGGELFVSLFWKKEGEEQDSGPGLRFLFTAQGCVCCALGVCTSCLCLQNPSVVTVWGDAVPWAQPINDPHIFGALPVAWSAAEAAFCSSRSGAAYWN